jgi:hypothetical protein
MSVYRTLPTFIAVLLWFQLGAPSETKADFNLDANTEKQINQLTEELLTGLRQYTGKISHSPLKKTRIALLPFQKDKIPLGKEIADQFNQTLLHGLMARGGKRYLFLAREDLKFIIDDLEATGRLDNSREDPIASLLKDAGQVDIIIKGKIRRHERKISLSYTAVGLLDGVIAGQTKPASFYLPDHEITRKSGLLTLDQAVNEAVKKLKENARDLQELRLGGIRYQDTGLQTEFARFLQDKLQSALANIYSEGLSGGPIKVVEPELKWTAAGKSLQDKDLRDEMQTDSNFSYLLKGTYWVLEDSIELNLNLVNRKRHAAFWNGSMRIEETKRLAYRPTDDFKAFREYDGIGPFKFTLTSKKGKDPVYKIGETLELILRIEKKAWVYCYYFQADRKVIQILPNPYFKQPLFRGKIAYALSDPKIVPFSLKIEPPVGRELLKCLAASRDITKELPKPLQGRTLKPLPKKTVDRLVASFRAIPRTRISEASLVLTILNHD